jgi:hypothetical protein
MLEQREISSTMEILNSNVLEMGSHHSQFKSHHHRLHCPGLVECDHCSNSSLYGDANAATTTSSKNISISKNTRLLDEDLNPANTTTTTSLINDDDDDLNWIHTMKYHSSSNSLRGKHLNDDIGCECGGTNYKNDNDNEVKTLANCCCDTLLGSLMEEEKEQENNTLPQVGQQTTFTTNNISITTLTRWKNDVTTCIHRCYMTLFPGIIFLFVY